MKKESFTHKYWTGEAINFPIVISLIAVLIMLINGINFFFIPINQIPINQIPSLQLYRVLSIVAVGVWFVYGLIFLVAVFFRAMKCGLK